MKRNTLGENLYKNAGYYAVVMISLIYIVSSLILISKTGRGVYEIVCTGFISLIVGSLINSSFRSIGFRRGEEDERTVSTTELHARAVDEITPYIDLLEEYCAVENKLAQKRIRAKILAFAGLKYEECFDENGVARELILTQGKEKRKDNKKKKKAYKKALHLRFKELLPSGLTSDGGNFNNPFDFGRSKREYNKSKNATDVFVRVIMAVIFGYFGVTLVSEINVATIIWNSLQIIMYVVSGIVTMYSTYTWIVDDYRQGIVKKIDYLERFKAFALKTSADEKRVNER